MTTFNAFRIHQDSSGHRAGLEALALDQLTPGEVTVRVEWSAVNYKDALAVTGRGKILRHSPLVGGVDAAGRVEESTDPRLPVGTPVVVTGGGLVAVDRDAHQFRTGLGELCDLYCGTEHIGGVGVGHGLHDHGMLAADGHMIDTDGHAGTALDGTCRAGHTGFDREE